jgi:hypothetical protein
MHSMISTPGITGMVGKWPWEEVLVDRDVLDAGAGFTQPHVHHAVHQQERVAVGGSRA